VTEVQAWTKHQANQLREALSGPAPSVVPVSSLPEPAPAPGAPPAPIPGPEAPPAAVFAPDAVPQAAQPPPPPPPERRSMAHPLPPPRRRGFLGRYRVAKIVGIVLLSLVVLIAGATALILIGLNGHLNIDTVDPMLGADRPTQNAPLSSVSSLGDPYARRAVNILVIGSDSRGGDNAAISQDKDPGGQRSDTTFIAHVSADRSRVEVVSIPRDTLITIPACVYADGSKVPQAGATKQKFNSAFSFGTAGKKGTLASGVACTIRAVEAMSQVPIDGYVVVDFAGFAKIVDAVGGVDLYLPCAVSSKKADNLNLPKGVNHLDGTIATNYARARTGTGLGDGSDLMRIQRQQALFKALANKVLGMNVMTSIGPLYGFVSSVADSMTTDLGNLTDLAGFAYSLRNFSLGNLTFQTVPIADAGDGANVVLVPEKDQPIWDALINDTPINPAPTPTPPPSAGATQAPPTTSPTPSDPAIPAGMVSAPANQCG